MKEVMAFLEMYFYGYPAWFYLGVIVIVFVGFIYPLDWVAGLRSKNTWTGQNWFGKRPPSDPGAESVAPNVISINRGGHSWKCGESRITKGAN